MPPSPLNGTDDDNATNSSSSSSTLSNVTSAVAFAGAAAATTTATTPVADTTATTTEAQLHPRIVPTDLRTDPIYSMYYVNLTRFLLTGAGPIVLLSYFYYRVSQECCTMYC